MQYHRSMLRKLVTDPRAFVQRQSKYPGIRTQAIVVTLVGLSFALGHLGTMMLLDDSFGHINQAVAVLATAELLMPFVLWVIISVLIYYIARLFQGYFTIGLLFQLVGWGMAPLVLSGLLRSIGRLAALQDAPPPEEPRFSAFEHQVDSYNAYAEAAISEPIFIATAVLAIPFVLYSAYVWALAVEHISGIEFREALAVCVVPTILTIGWVLSPFFL